MTQAKHKTPSLELDGVIGFNGVPQGTVCLHPDDEHMIFALGCSIVVKHVSENVQYFLQKDGHDREVSAMCLSPSGKYLASGQESPFKATIIIWNLETCEAVHRLSLHKGKVQALSFSADDQFLCSLGGCDDNQIVVWEVETGRAICGAMSANQTTLTVNWLTNSNTQLVSAGKNGNAKIWDFDYRNRKLHSTPIQMGQMRRNFLCSTASDDGKQIYLGSASGDVFCIGTASKLFQGAGPKGKGYVKFSQGIVSICKTRQELPGHIIVGAGDGNVALINCKTLRIVRKKKFSGSITSIALNAAGDHFFVATSKSNLYLVALDDFDWEVRATAHHKSIHSVAFARGLSDLFATCSGDVRVWHAAKRKELLRIEVPNLECNCVTFATDGKAIITGWSDGRIRAFGPISGKLMFVINDAHRGGVTALASSNDSKRIVSGGHFGEVRVWNIGRQTQTMVASMKEHKSKVNSVSINDDDTKCLTGGADGSSIIWDLTQFNRSACLFATTQFKSAIYHPDQSQILTCGTDRKITWWDVVKGSEIRIVDGSQTDAMNGVDISPDGDWFATAGASGLVKVWNYDSGATEFTGRGHSGSIVAAKISPDQTYVVSVGTEGAIFMWKMPPQCQMQAPQE